MKKTDLINNHILIKGAKLNFQVFPSLKLEDNNLEFLHLISSAVLSGHLRNVCFYNASFLSTKFSEVTFEGCDLKSSDLCSIWANSCSFLNTDFSNATISDSTFINCTFDGAIFESISLTRCQFVDCTFEQLLIDDSTFSLNTFIKCHIKRTHFTESFYFQIFDSCTFHEVKMDPTLLGFNYGFSPQILKQLATESDLKRVDSEFTNKKLYINAAILRINQVQNYYDEAMIACVAALGHMIKNDILIKADEIEFLKNLTTYFQESKQITPITILRIWQLLSNNIMNIPPNIATNKAMPLIREYANMLYFDFIDFQTKLQELLYKLPNASALNETVELKMVYTEKPQLPLLNYLIEFSSLVGPDCPMPSLIRTETGSFLEYHEIAVAILPYLQTLFGFLGVAVPIVIYKKQKDNHEEEKQVKNTSDAKEEETVEITVTTKADSPSPILLPNISAITSSTNDITTNVIKILASQSTKSNSGFCGYNNNNIQAITIRFH